MKVVIDRSKWLRGNPNKSMLLNRHVGRCCLGFLGRAHGLPDCAAYGVGLPAHVRRACLWPERLFEVAPFTSAGGDEARWEHVFAAINDVAIDEPTREEWIRTGFAIVLDADVEFTDPPPAEEER